MRPFRLFSFFSFFPVLACLGLVSLSAQDIPPKPSPAVYVNDYAGWLNEQEKQVLENKLRQYDDSTSTQIVLVVVNSLKGNSIESYANTWARTWGIGQKGADNGILIMASKNDRKVRIEAGYGTEGFITDAFSKELISQILIPNFKKRLYFEGFDQASTRIMEAVAGSFKPENTRSPKEQEAPSGFWKIVMLSALTLGFVSLSFAIFSYVRRK